MTRDFNKYNDKIIKIPCGISTEKIERKPTKTILYVGRLEEYKGVQHIIKTMKFLNNYELIIVGKGSYENQLKEFAKEYKVENQITWLNNVSRFELLHLYSLAGVFVMLSDYESFGITVAEALSFGVPSLVKNGSALSEFVDNKSCIGLDNINYDEIVYLIQKLTKTNVEKPKIHSWNEIVQNLIKIYEE